MPRRWCPAWASPSPRCSALERQPGEFIDDPWVSERVTLVAEQRQPGRGRRAPAALLRRRARRAGLPRPGRDPAGSCSGRRPRPATRAGRTGPPAAEALMTACLGQFDRWGVTRQDAGGELPVPGVYGVPEQWPHVRALYERAGFAHTGHTEIVYLARVEDLARPARRRCRADRARSVGHQRLPAVRRARRRGGRLRRGGDPRRGRAAVTPRRLGRHRQPARGRAVPAPRGRDLAARARRPTGCGSRRWTACSTTPGWTARTRAAWTTPPTGRSSRRIP